MSAIQEISNEAISFDTPAGRGAVDRVESLKAMRAALDKIRAAAESEASRDAPTEVDPKDQRLGPQLDYRTLDLDGNGALTVQEMDKMKPPLPPHDYGPTLAERAMQSRAMAGADEFHSAQSGRDAMGLFMQRLKQIQSA